MKKIIILALVIFPKLLMAQKDTCIIMGTIAKSTTEERVYIVADLLGASYTQRFIGEDKFLFKVPVEAGMNKVIGIRISYFDTSGFITEDQQTVFLDTTRAFYGRVRNADIIALLLSPGSVEISINDVADLVLQKTITGPRSTMDYEEKLRTPVIMLNKELDEVQGQLEGARKSGNPDTVGLYLRKMEIIRRSFAVNKNYIKSNPSSIVSVKALEMMGAGDPTINNPSNELGLLFNSLSAEVKTSRAGVAYSAKLKQMQN